MPPGHWNPSLNPPAPSAPPTDEEKIAALKTGAQDLTQSVGQATGPGADAATRLSDDLNKLAAADVSVRAAAEFAMVRPLKLDLDELRQALKPQRVTLENLPPDIRRDWVAPDGRARAEATPKQDTDDNQALRQFALAVLAAEPDATGPAISTFEWAQAMIDAFIQAAAWALCSIAILLWIVLRRAWDVMLTLVPLAGRGSRNPGNMRLATLSNQLCQYHCAAGPARRWRRLQDLLRAGVATRRDEFPAIAAYSRGFFQCTHDGDRVRQPMALEPSRFVEHG